MSPQGASSQPPSARWGNASLTAVGSWRSRATARRKLVSRNRSARHYFSRGIAVAGVPIISCSCVSK